MIDLYTKQNLRLRWNQSRYFVQPKARNVNWDKARRTLDHRLFIWREAEEY